MRIGIFDLATDAEAGGAFTIQRDIVDALAQESGRTRHDLFLFSFSRDGGTARIPMYRIEQPDPRARALRV
ncbi:MAG TPA: hypothetical protein VJ801_16695, partial [Polyangia bacterium]|nr:hypothetical protein [Polyangia bacterium]